MSNFKSADIIWIKNVNDTINGESTGKSYMDKNENDELVLRFNQTFGDNAKSPKIGELILLFQKTETEERIFTHLVTPIDDELKENVPTIWNGEPKLVNGRDTKVVKKKKIFVDSIKSWKNVNFQGISQGNACKIAEVESCKNIYKTLIDDIWNEFNK